MLKVAAFMCVCAAACCSQALAAAGGRSDSGNFLDDKQWLTTVSQYDKEVGQWNKFRDDDYFRTWSPGKPFDQEEDSIFSENHKIQSLFQQSYIALDPAKDPCLKMKCSRHKVCIAQDQQTAVCISHRRLTHSMKEAGLGHKQWRGGLISSNCKQCPVVYTNPVCGSDGHTYSSQCKLEYQACVAGKHISVKCEGRCPCPSDKPTSIGRNDKRVCSDLEFREIANRLRDWFKALHESGIQNKKTRIVQRPERSNPPCQTELSNIQKQQGGKKLLGQYIPLCDEDGYYKPSQCHGSAGQCWCVDRYGNEVTGSRTNGAADCAINLEISGDFASGDFHEWTDDEDDEDDIMNDEDEIDDDDDDDEDEGDDDVDDDDDHDGYI
ncbi:testican-3 isoform X5 [Emydura macquarii macquarii]|uniref:testican-3 isoform X5 n=1 Tax=Emydura macquarii macquarii TaxID=1129001 RepID=UPI00352B0B45